VNELEAWRQAASELRRLPTPQLSSWLVQATLAISFTPAIEGLFLKTKPLFSGAHLENMICLVLLPVTFRHPIIPITFGSFPQSVAITVLSPMVSCN
jgi:hypothetical protein